MSSVVRPVEPEDAIAAVLALSSRHIPAARLSRSRMRCRKNCAISGEKRRITIREISFWRLSNPSHTTQPRNRRFPCKFKI